MHDIIRHWKAIAVCASLTVLAAIVNGQLQLPVTESPESPWTGRWMPHPPYSEHADIHDREHAVRMGVITTTCDDAKVCTSIFYVTGLVHVCLKQLYPL
jgi:hypothetical protein